MIDLAGSERAADSKNHTKARMDETKQINLSLMALKECIRARTMASAPGAALTVHVRLWSFHELQIGVVCVRLMLIPSCLMIPTMNSTHGDDSHVCDTCNIQVPYRRSKLTLLLKDVFDHACSESILIFQFIDPRSAG